MHFAKSAKEKARTLKKKYQILYTITDLLKVIIVSLTNLLFNNLSGFRMPGPAWFRKSYILVLAAAVIPGVKQCFMTSSLLLSIAMAADRVFSIAKPFLYLSIDHSATSNYCRYLLLRHWFRDYLI